MAEIPESTQVYLTRPAFGVPPAQTPARGRAPSRPRVLSPEQPVEVRQLVRAGRLSFQRIPVRHTERGVLDDPFALRRVWTLRDGALAEEWLVIRHENEHRDTYALSNAAADSPAERLAGLKCTRHFVERSNQDAKSEIGWDELQAQKYRAWEHHLALTILATWFIAQTKLEWSQTYPHDPNLVHQLELEVLPALSVANVRLLLQPCCPCRNCRLKRPRVWSPNIWLTAPVPLEVACGLSVSSAARLKSNIVELFNRVTSESACLQGRTTVNGSCYFAAPGETGLNWQCEAIRLAEPQFSRSSTGPAR